MRWQYALAFGVWVVGFAPAAYALAPRQVGLVSAVSNRTASGSIGAAALTTDVRAITIAQTTAGLTLTLPTPTDQSVVAGLDVLNIGTVSFTMYGAVVTPGSVLRVAWGGSSWAVDTNVPGVEPMNILTTGATQASPYQASSTDTNIILNKTTGSPSYIIGVASPVTGKILVIKDKKGDSATNPITFTPANGGTVDGKASFTFGGANNSVTFKYDGSEWGVD